MEDLEAVMRAALDGRMFYEHNDPRSVTGTYVGKAEVVKKQTRADVSATITYYRVLPQYQKLVDAVAKVHDIEPDLLASTSRTKRVSFARTHLMYEMRHRTKLSLPQIGRAIGVDHSTVLYHVRKFEGVLAQHYDKVWKLKHVLNEA